MLERSSAGAPTYARHRLAWLDQLAYELFRATGRSQLMQCLWLYDRDVNRAALVLPGMSAAPEIVAHCFARKPPLAASWSFRTSS